MKFSSASIRQDEERIYYTLVVDLRWWICQSSTMFRS
jgi:hypothetical protein